MYEHLVPVNCENMTLQVAKNSSKQVCCFGMCLDYRLDGLVSSRVGFWVDEGSGLWSCGMSYLTGTRCLAGLLK